ncbi:hypothetical protein GH975_03655 [Litorivicinus lipolyticus]|uniref:Inositol monophosphatase n=1 Tax=Litorivicinus lipolyticus TaxID=418701 RepID=A0A5Q2QCZ7_9GAMM|nr:hypothetical protein [Litorivicinus lipolyticus]QGG79710.1 hypothetical protein GH975_03655 [Litorivicinus lipolyticus]
MTPAANLALRVAHRVGDTLVRQLDRTFQKNDAPLDDAALAEFRDFIVALAKEELSQAHPGDTVTASIKDTTDGYSWLVSLSGEDSLRRGLPEFSLAITRFEKGSAVGVAIYSPMRQEQFTAGKGSGAGFQGRRVRGTGITRAEGAYGAVFGVNAPFLAGTLSTGDTLRDLALAATNRVDLAIAYDLDAELKAPLALLFAEAGHLMGDRVGGPYHAQGSDLIAAPAKCFRTLIPELKALNA